MAASGLNVTPTSDAFAYRNLFDIARKHYVSARVCLVNGMTESACLLAQQCIEAYLKAIAHARNLTKPEIYCFETTEVGKIPIWGHDLVKLVQYLSADSSTLNSLLANPSKRDFLDQLKNAYESMRYGEANSAVVYATLIQQLDESVQLLDEVYHKKMNISTRTLLGVPTALQDNFLLQNKVFQKSEITNFTMSNLVPGLDLSDFLKKFNFDNAKVVQSASASTDKKKP